MSLDAWTCLQDDDCDVRNLQTVNEGLGQTHRARLMQDVSSQDYTGNNEFQESHNSKDSRSEHVGKGGRSSKRLTARAGGAKPRGYPSARYSDNYFSPC